MNDSPASNDASISAAAPSGPPRGMAAPVDFVVDPQQAVDFRRAVGEVCGAIRHALDARLECRGVTAAQCVVLHMLRERPEAHLCDVGEQLRMDAPSLSRIVGRLESRGLCTRYKARGDRRVARVQLRADGVALADAWPALQAEVTELVLRGFDPAERALLFAGMGRMLRTADLLA